MIVRWLVSRICRIAWWVDFHIFECQWPWLCDRIVALDTWRYRNRER